MAYGIFTISTAAGFLNHQLYVIPFFFVVPWGWMIETFIRQDDLHLVDSKNETNETCT